jgi:hypothetical protein
MTSDDRAYLLRRAEQERARADRAASISARMAHAALATAYERRAQKAVFEVHG